MLHAWRREPARAQELATQSLALAEERTFGMWRHRAGLVLRWAEAELAPVTSEERADELLNKPWVSVALGRTQPSLVYAALCARLGRTDKALEVIAQTLASLAQGEERWLEPEFHRLRGTILMTSDAKEAERSVLTAIDVAKKQCSLSLELRATLSLHSLVSGAKKARARRELGSPAAHDRRRPGGPGRRGGAKRRRELTHYAFVPPSTTMSTPVT